MEEYIKRLAEFKKPDLKDIKKITSAEYYYDPNSHLSIHEQIINDYDTNEIFKGWIENNGHLFKGKIVMEIGCGTGIFSMMAAKAGAAKVIAFEHSNIAEYAKRIIKVNNFDHIVDVIKDKVENVTSLPSEIRRVDVIMSMWMGFSLFHGGKLKAVLQAKDKWLRPGGFIIPDRAQLYISGVTDDYYRENCINWWKNVYGYDMSDVIDESLKYAQNLVVNPEKIITNKCSIKDVNLKTQTYREIMKETVFQITAKSNDYIQGFCTHFTVKFTADVKQTELSTDPLLKTTHFGQTVFYFKDYYMIKRKEKIRGTFSFFNVNNDTRFLGVIIGVHFKGEKDERSDIKEFIVRS